MKRVLVSEFIGTCLLVATVIGSGTRAISLVPNVNNISFAIVVASGDNSLSVPAIGPNSTTVVVNSATTAGSATSSAADVVTAMLAQANQQSQTVLSLLK